MIFVFFVATSFINQLSHSFLAVLNLNFSRFWLLLIHLKTMLIIYKISKKEKKMKICTFMIASINFIMFFALRSAYFYVKPCLKDLYHLTDLFLSLMDVSLFLGIAAGHLLRFCFTNPRNIIKPF